MNKYKEGDIVQLKSGGPKMTVSDLSMDKSHYTCKWFSGSRLEDGHFPEDALMVPATNDKKKKES
jgi:uncharacterized protein YodC (DUF2158 family)